MSNHSSDLYVIKRDGERQDISFDKILKRLTRLVDGTSIGQPKLDLNPSTLSQRVIQELIPGIETTKLDQIAANIAAYGASENIEMTTLAARILISDLHKRTNSSFVETMTAFNKWDMLNPEFYKAVLKHGSKLDEMIIHGNDYKYDFMGIKTLIRTYLCNRTAPIPVPKKDATSDDKLIEPHSIITVWERPQYLLMRVAVAIHLDDLDAIRETYLASSELLMTHATPTLMNAGLRICQFSSCFLLEIKDDSIDGIYKTLADCAKISKCGGGIGVNITKIRSRGSLIKGTNGHANGIGAMLSVYDATAGYVDQGGNKRKGSFAIYMEPWNMEILEFLNLKRDHGTKQLSCLNLFYGVWIPDIFMRRFISGEMFTLFSPHEVPMLLETSNAEFDMWYEKYEKDETITKKSINPREIWMAILATHSETGVPYWMFKDTVCDKSNQKHLGPIKCSNLCTEIVQYTSPDEIAVCNLASINVASCAENGVFNFERLEEITKMLVRNLNKVIDINMYPVEEAKTSNLRHRPMGIGIQGLANAFFKMRYPFESEEAETLNRKICEHMYLAACEESCRLAEKDGPYPSFKGSPASKGILHPDMYNEVIYSAELNDRFNAVREKLQLTGDRNSYKIALMPTASTSLILGQSEGFDPLSANYFARKTSTGIFHQLNSYLVDDLKKIGLWDRLMFEEIVLNNGSIQAIESIPQEIRDLYKTVREVPIMTHLNRALHRQWFVDQAQSSSLYLPKNPTTEFMTALFVKGWQMGLKTGCYYGRQQPIAEPPKHGLTENNKRQKMECAYVPGGASKADSDCTMCGS